MNEVKMYKGKGRNQRWSFLILLLLSESSNYTSIPFYKAQPSYKKKGSFYFLTVVSMALNTCTVFLMD